MDNLWSAIAAERAALADDLAGRRAFCDDLTGPGVTTLRARI